MMVAVAMSNQNAVKNNWQLTIITMFQIPSSECRNGKLIPSIVRKLDRH